MKTSVRMRDDGEIAVSRRKALAKEGRGWGDSNRKHLPTYPGEGGGKLRRLRWFPPPSPQLLRIEPKTPKAFDTQSFSLQPKVCRGRGERTISDAEVPFPLPREGNYSWESNGCPNPSISLADAEVRKPINPNLKLYLYYTTPPSHLQVYFPLRQKFSSIRPTFCRACILTDGSKACIIEA